MQTYPVEVERARARFSSWYEIFPRSASPVTLLLDETFANSLPILTLADHE